MKQGSGVNNTREHGAFAKQGVEVAAWQTRGRDGKWDSVMVARMSPVLQRLSEESHPTTGALSPIAGLLSKSPGRRI